MFRALPKFMDQRLNFTASEVYPNLFQASKIKSDDAVVVVKDLGIKCVVDLEGGLDPEMRFLWSYLFWPISDVPLLPDLDMLMMVALYIKGELELEHRVLVHCWQGLNRAGLVCGLVMVLMGLSGEVAIERIRAKRPGALWNPVFAEFIEKLG